jgi:DNA-binding SARP family transcriptional activator
MLFTGELTGEFLVRLIPRPAVLIRGCPVKLPPQGDRLVARLALERMGNICREQVIDDLGMSGAMDPRRQLRKAAWQVNRQVGRQLIVGDRAGIGLDPRTVTDFHLARDGGHALIRGGFADDAVAAAPAWLTETLSHPLLEGWDTGWAAGAQHEWEVLRLEALRGLASTELRRGNTAAAVLYSECVVRNDALCEHAWRVLVSALLESGRRATAAHRFAQLTRLLDEELGVSPTFGLDELADEVASAA